MAKKLEKATILSVKARFKDIGAGGLVDLRHLDFTELNMQDPQVKQGFDRVAQLQNENHEDPPMYIDMTGANLNRADLRGYNLTSVIMSEISAEYAVFINAVLSDTHLNEANLRFADFRQADLYHTKLYDSDITQANFSGAKLKFTHGLGAPDTAVERLGVVNTIRDAELPEVIEPFREEIQEAIRAARGEEFAQGSPGVAISEKDANHPTHKDGGF